MDVLSGNVVVPLDICDWISPATLTLWIREEVSKLNGVVANGEIPKVLRTVLAFAYARGIFDSEEILRLSQSDPAFLELCGGVVFTPEQLLSVRHKERGVLVTLTVRLLTRAVAEKFKVATAELPPELKRRLHENAVDRLDNARHINRGDAL
jgi:hypothetical protein